MSKNANMLQQKVKVLQKLFDNNVRSEKDLQALDMDRILSIPNITIQDMKIIAEFQKQSKANKLFSYLGGADEPPVTEKD